MADRSKDFPTETAAMRVLTFSSSPRADRSFTVGLWLVILFAATEIIVAGYHYLGLGRFRSARVEPTTATAVPSTVLIPAPSAPPLKMEATPPPAAVASPPSVLSEPDRLIKDAVALRDKGDTTTALTKLQEAVQRDPKNARALEEMATTYESMGLIDRSNETWRKIRDLGPSAGDLFAKAERRLKIGIQAAAGATPAVAAASLAAGSLRREAGTSTDNAAFEISDVKVTESPDPDADTNLLLRINVKKLTPSATDHTKVKIQVFFYDTVDDKDIKLTDADVSYEWLTSKHDWTESDTETLAVTYLRPKNRVVSQDAALSAAAAAVVPGRKNKAPKAKEPSGADAGATGEAGRHRYLGYIVRIYYKDQLQSVRADPPKLLSLFPTPSTSQ